MYRPFTVVNTGTLSLAQSYHTVTPGQVNDNYDFYINHPHLSRHQRLDSSCRASAIEADCNHDIVVIRPYTHESSNFYTAS